MTDPQPRAGMSRRTLIALIVPVVLIVGYFGVTATIRSHVDGLIQHSVGHPLPEFQLADRAGKSWSNADLRGKRAVLHFFRSKCGSCDDEAPAIREFEQRLPADVVRLHVMTDAVLGFPLELTVATIDHEKFQRPVLMADAAFVNALHQVKWSNVTPITYVVDATGTVRFGLRGKQTVASIEQALAAAK